MDYLRDDILWLLPALAIALVQVKIIWERLPRYKEEETEIEGTQDEYNFLTGEYLQYLTYFILTIQLGIKVLEIDINNNTLLLVRSLGYLLIFYGFVTSYKAVKALGYNWTGMLQYRIKKEQTLITQGIYKKVRHPIYAAVILEILGFELVANSWLFIVLFFCLLIYSYKQAQKEEKLLIFKYGESYLSYKKSTYYFFPYIF